VLRLLMALALFQYPSASTDNNSRIARNGISSSAQDTWKLSFQMTNYYQRGLIRMHLLVTHFVSPISLVGFANSPVVHLTIASNVQKVDVTTLRDRIVVTCGITPLTFRTTRTSSQNHRFAHSILVSFALEFNHHIFHYFYCCVCDFQTHLNVVAALSTNACGDCGDIQATPATIDCEQFDISTVETLRTGEMRAFRFPLPHVRHLSQNQVYSE
jgi:hypothetical protein